MSKLRDRKVRTHVKDKTFEESCLYCGNRSLLAFNAAITFPEALILIEAKRSAELCGSCLNTMKSWDLL